MNLATQVQEQLHQAATECQHLRNERDAARELLKRYMAFIIDLESISFLDSHSYDVKLTPEEKAQLAVVEVEIRRELRHV